MCRLQKTQDQLPPHHPYKDTEDTLAELSELQYWAKEHLIMSTTSIQHLASDVVKVGLPEDAELAYLRALKLFESSPLRRSEVYVDLLREIILFYTKKGNTLRAGKYRQEFSVLASLPGLDTIDIDVKTLRFLAESTRTSTARITKIFPSDQIKKIWFKVKDPLPQSYRMARVVSTSKLVTADVPIEWDAYDITGVPLLHSAILFRNVNVNDLVHSCCLNDLLEITDLHRRTALFFAALHRQEDVCLSIMERFAGEPEGILDRLMNARDRLGNTILTIAIFSHCSTFLIESMIKSGSSVNPDQIEDSYSPLASAAITSREDVYFILKSHGAQDVEAQAGITGAWWHIFSDGNETILQRLPPPS